MIFQSPVPPLPVEPPGPVEQVFAFLVVYFLMLSMIVLALPQKWQRRVLEVAFRVEDEVENEGSHEV